MFSAPSKTFRRRFAPDAGFDSGIAITVVSNKLEHEPRRIYAGLPSLFGFGLEDGYVPTFGLLLYIGYDTSPSTMIQIFNGLGCCRIIPLGVSRRLSACLIGSTGLRATRST